MEALIEKLKIILADSFAFYLKTHNFHFNIEGSDFFQYHKLFELIYEEVLDSIDSIGEHIRALNAYVPASFSRFLDLTNIEDAKTIPTGFGMSTQLMSDNEKVMDSLRNGIEEARKANAYNVENFLQDRLDAHAKHGWMLRSSIKNF